MGMEPYYDYLAFKQGMESGSKYYTIGDSFYREVAFFFNGTYSYKGRYTINGTYRYEGTNKMGKSRKARWLPTWNISGAWNVHEEKFFSHVQPALSHLSLKASYSLTADRGRLTSPTRWPSSKPRPRGARPAAIPKPVSKFRASKMRSSPTRRSTS